jgi:hypothetical protein
MIGPRGPGPPRADVTVHRLLDIGSTELGEPYIVKPVQRCTGAVVAGTEQSEPVVALVVVGARQRERQRDHDRLVGERAGVRRGRELGRPRRVVGEQGPRQRVALARTSLPSSRARSAIDRGRRDLVRPLDSSISVAPV